MPNASATAVQVENATYVVEVTRQVRPKLLRAAPKRDALRGPRERDPLRANPPPVPDLRSVDLRWHFRQLGIRSRDMREYLVLVCLNCENSRRCSFAGQRYYARRLGVDERTIRRWNAKLEAEHYLRAFDTQTTNEIYPDWERLRLQQVTKKMSGRNGQRARSPSLDNVPTPSSPAETRGKSSSEPRVDTAQQYPQPEQPDPVSGVDDDPAGVREVVERERAEMAAREAEEAARKAARAPKAPEPVRVPEAADKRPPRERVPPRPEPQPDAATPSPPRAPEPARTLQVGRFRLDLGPQLPLSPADRRDLVRMPKGAEALGGLRMRAAEDYPLAVEVLGRLLDVYRKGELRENAAGWVCRTWQSAVAKREAERDLASEKAEAEALGEPVRPRRVELPAEPTTPPLAAKSDEGTAIAEACAGFAEKGAWQGARPASKPLRIEQPPAPRQVIAPPPPTLEELRDRIAFVEAALRKDPMRADREKLLLRKEEAELEIARRTVAIPS